ncbi:MAG TPA: LysR family transcriptional regulator [Casimicrobiaceae bacterium]|nr:LysR family transcriptional regulator [Casimicrobiaceae bacterium]
MELSQLRAFVEIAKAGQLTRAAERLHLSQPALSGQLKALEEGLGIALFERTSTGMTLTPGGRSLLADAEGILAAIQQLKQSAQQLRGRPAGRLSIGTVLDPVTLRLGEFLARAIESYPLIDIELHQLFSGAALDGVRSGRLDASFYYGALKDPALAGEALRTLSYRVALPAEWGLDARKVDWGAIASRPWILAPETSSHRVLAMDLFAARGLAPTQVIEADNETVIVNLIESGVGASLAREEIALALEQEGRIAVWPQARLETKLWFIHQTQRDGDPLLEAVRSLLQEVWRQDEQVPQPMAI